MCEFCSLGPNSNQHGRDESDLRFAGFFSAEAIEAAVRQAAANSSNSSDGADAGGGSGNGETAGEDDDDGT